MKELARLNLFTGKGGVGKSTCAQAYYLFLQKNNHKVSYYKIKSAKLDATSKTIPHELILEDCLAEYIQEKIYSQTLTQWILKAQFFRALINMLPSFGYLIYLGKIIKELKKSPESFCVVDCPASGHFLNLIFSTQTFLKIFKIGKLKEDTQKVHESLHHKGFLKIWLVALPTQLSCRESAELYQELQEFQAHTQILLNQSLTEFERELNTSEYFAKKIEEEKKATLMLPCDYQKLPVLIQEGRQEISHQLAGLFP